MYSDREQREREEALRDFKSGAVPILVATSVAARGLDIAGVNHVINYEMPQAIEDYVHRIGRTGRCGNIGRATSFFDPQADMHLARPLIKIMVDVSYFILIKYQYLFHRLTRTAYLYNVCLPWYNVVLTSQVHSSVKYSQQSQL